MKKTYDALIIEYEELLSKYNDLKYDYQENTIVQSMNDMKKRYERLLETTVSLEEYKKLEAVKKSAERKLIATSVLTEKIIDSLKKFEQEIVQTYTNDNDILAHYQLYKIQLHMMFLKEILE